ASSRRGVSVSDTLAGAGEQQALARAESASHFHVLVVGKAESHRALPMSGGVDDGDVARPAISHDGFDGHAQGVRPVFDDDPAADVHPRLDARSVVQTYSHGESHDAAVVDPCERLELDTRREPLPAERIDADDGAHSRVDTRGVEL